MAPLLTIIVGLVVVAAAAIPAARVGGVQGATLFNTLQRFRFLNGGVTAASDVSCLAYVRAHRVLCRATIVRLAVPSCRDTAAYTSIAIRCIALQAFHWEAIQAIGENQKVIYLEADNVSCAPCGT